MKIHIDTDTTIRLEIPVKRHSRSHTKSESLILHLIPSRLQDTLTVDVNNDSREYWLTYRKYGRPDTIYYISSKEYLELLDFLKAHDVKPWDQDFSHPLRIANPIMELEL